MPDSLATGPQDHKQLYNRVVEYLGATHFPEWLNQEPKHYKNVRRNFCLNGGSMTTEGERQARAQRIDPQLKAVDWYIAPFATEAAVCA